MKIPALIGALALSLALAACGDSGSTAATTQATQVSTTPEQEDRPKPPPGTSAADPIPDPYPEPRKVSIPAGPAPDRIVVKDLEKGWGPVVKPQSRLALHFVGIDYKSQKPFEVQWDLKKPFVFEFDHGLELQGWEEGLPGMKVGGRRKLIVPSELAYGEGDVVYVVDLLAVEDRSKYARPRRSG